MGVQGCDRLENLVRYEAKDDEFGKGVRVQASSLAYPLLSENRGSAGHRSGLAF